MCTYDHNCRGCLSEVRLSRRSLLTAAAGSAAALHMGLLDFTSTLVELLFRSGLLLAKVAMVFSECLYFTCRLTVI